LKQNGNLDKKHHSSYFLIVKKVTKCLLLDLLIDFIDFKSKELCASGHKNKQEI